jgi:FkbM family methyltransferase
LFVFGSYERETQEAVLAHLPKGGTLVDVGANIGAISIPIAKARPDARIVSVEASPSVFNSLSRNIAANGVINITPICQLVGADERSADFYPAPTSHFGMGSVGPQFGSTPISLQQDTLDNILSSRGLPIPDVIKIDVEGAELSVLQGTRRLLSSSNPPVIIFEFCDWAEERIGQRAGCSQDFLLTHGYELRDLKSGRPIVEPLRSGFTMIIATR